MIVVRVETISEDLPAHLRGGDPPGRMGCYRTGLAHRAYHICRDTGSGLLNPADNPSTRQELMNAVDTSRCNMWIAVPEAWRHGFRDWGHMLRWFPDGIMRQTMHELGLCAAEYQVPDEWVISMPAQVVFMASEAVHVRDLHLSTMQTLSFTSPARRATLPPSAVLLEEMSILC